MNYKNDIYSIGNVLTFDGPLSIEHCSKLKEILISTMEQADAIIIDFENITDLDLSCIQIFCSASKSAEVHEKQLTIKENNSEVVNQNIENSGFIKDGKCIQKFCSNCFWTGGDDNGENYFNS